MRRRSAWIASASIVVLGVAYFALGPFGRGGTRDESATSGAISAAGASLADGATLDRDPAVETPDQAGRAVVPVADASAVATAASEHAPADAATLLVRTVDKLSRAPLAGVRLDVSRKEPDESAAPGEDALGSKGDLAHRPLTDADGRAELSVPAGVDLELWAYAVDGRCETRTLDVTPLRPSERRDLVVELLTGDDLHVFGKVVDDGGAPIAGARVLVARAETSIASELDARIGRARTILFRTTTSPEGEFELRMPSWRQAFVRVEAEGFALATLRRCDGHDSRDRPLEVRLARSATLEARVVDPAGGAVPDVAVRLVAKGYTLPPRSTSAASGYVDVPDEQWLATTGSDGRCTLRDVCPDVPMAIELLRGERLLWREPEPLVFVRGQVLERAWTVGGGCTLRGVVLDQDSKPVPGLELWLMKASVPQARTFRPRERDQVSVRTTTDADGRFLIANIEPGTWWIGPAAKERGSTMDASGGSVRETPSAGEVAPAATRVELLSAGTQDVTLRVFRGLFIRGKVLDPDGRGVRGVWVTASPAGSPWGSTCDTDRDGAFVAGPLAEGAFSLVAEATDRFPESESVEARAGDTDVVLRLRAGGGIRALVVDSRTGKPCAAELILAPHLAGGGNIDDGIAWGVDEKGVVDWQGLLPGSYDLAAKTEDGCFGILVGIGVVVGEKGKEHVLSVAPGGRLRMSYDGPEPYVSFDYLVDGGRVDWGGQVVRGQPLERAAPAGTITIEIHSIDDGAPTRKRVVHLNPGEVKEIRLEADD